MTQQEQLRELKAECNQVLEWRLTSEGEGLGKIESVELLVDLKDLFLRLRNLAETLQRIES